MKLSISNIAWENGINEEIYSFMKENNFQGIEIAPNKTFGDIEEIDYVKVNNYVKNLNSYGIKPIAMQSILYGKTDMHLFQQESRYLLNNYLVKIIDLAKVLNIKSIIFGSPKNRIIPQYMTNEQALEISLRFFKELGEYAYQNNTNICIEPNPSIYGGNFLLNNLDTLNFVKLVDSKGCKMHLDIGSIIENKENIEQSILECLPYINHIHLSQPYLEPLKTSNIRRKIFRICRDNGYDGYYSIEMKNTDILKLKQVIKYIYDEFSKCQK